MNKIKKLKRAVIKEEFVDLTGDFICAIVLNQMIQLTEEQDSNLIYKKPSDLVDDLMLYDEKTNKKRFEKTIYKCLEYLIKNNWIQKNGIHEYRVNLTKIINDLRKIGYDLYDYKIIE